ncbi:MAG TPA: hypothetical protein VF669_21840 [Tepidisphaeraceae bacterium]|jgi:hypothetical protein
MSPERIKTLLDRDRFQPFTVVKGDGEEVNVISRDLVLLRPGGRTLHVVAPKFAGAKTEADFEDHYIDVFLVTDVIQPPRKQNGRHGRKKRQ